MCQTESPGSSEPPGNSGRFTTRRGTTLERLTIAQSSSSSTRHLTGSTSTHGTSCAPCSNCGTRTPETERDVVAGWLLELFGPAIGRYFDAASGVTDQTFRIAMCNLASFDGDVVLAHHSNRRIIGGRHPTHFKSAFFVQTPVVLSRSATYAWSRSSRCRLLTCRSR